LGNLKHTWFLFRVPGSATTNVGGLTVMKMDELWYRYTERGTMNDPQWFPPDAMRFAFWPSQRIDETVAFALRNVVTVDGG